MPSIAIYTLGCKVNQADGAAMAELFRRSGYRVVDFLEAADVYIINTCVVTNEGQRKSRQLIRRAVRNNPGALVAVAGCYPQTAAEEVKNIPGVRLVIGNDQRAGIVRLVEEARLGNSVDAVKDLPTHMPFEELPSGQAEDRTRAFLKIQEGCNQFCTYCIIPYARGPLRSRSPGGIRREAAQLVELGYREIVLIGIHLGAYGCEPGSRATLVEAVKSVLALPGVKRVRLGSIESVELDDRLFALMEADERLCRHLHLPLQSGCDFILKNMNRPYTAGQFAALADSLRSRLPGLALTTDVIVGFPGETEEMFEKTLDFVRMLDFAKVHIFPFSVRKGTPAEHFSGQLPETVKHERAARLAEVAEKGRVNFLSGLINENVQVLLEQKDRSTGLLSGLTTNYQKVFLKAEENLLGEIVDARIDSLYKDGLLGAKTSRNF